MSSSPEPSPDGLLTPTGRIHSIHDGIFAVALTLLVLDIELPPLPGDLTSGQLAAALFALGPRLEVWAVSFAVVGTLWVQHRNTVGRFPLGSTRTTVLHLAFLMLISVVPLSIRVVGDHPELVSAMVFFYGNILAASLLVLAQLGELFRLGGRHASALPQTFRDPAMRRSAWAEVGVLPVVAIACIALAPLHWRAALWGWLLVPITLGALYRWRVRRAG